MAWPILGTILGFFTGGSGDGGKTVEKVGNVVDEAFHTDQEKSEEASADLISARKFIPGEQKDSIVDVWHRAIRPLVATWAVLVLFGLIPPPLHWHNIPGEVWAIILTVITFYFGGRGFLQDVRTRIANGLGNGKDVS